MHKQRRNLWIFLIWQLCVILLIFTFADGEKNPPEINVRCHVIHGTQIETGKTLNINCKEYQSNE